MKKCIYVGIFAFFGAMVRYCIKNISVYNYKEVLPINIMLINVIGSFLMALILTFSTEGKEKKEELRLGITTGFLGAFTTFSTFCKETVNLMQQGMYFSTLGYVAISILLGLTAAYLGVIIARIAALKIAVKSHNEEDSEENVV